MSTDLDRRVGELETRLAFQDDLLTTLDRMVAAQDRLLTQLRTEIVRLRAAQDALQVASGDNPADEPPPPHY